MAIHDIFSKRQKKATGKGVDVFQYDDIPRHLRVQVAHIWKDVVGIMIAWRDDPIFGATKDILCREYGLFRLVSARCDNGLQEVTKFFLESANTEQAIDVIETTFRLIETLYSKNDCAFVEATMSPQAGIEELNERFRENGVGYQYVSGSIIRVDSTLIHKEVVLPALEFLSDPAFKGANDEYLKAHKAYRDHEYDTCLNECLKAFESTLKIIFKERKWTYASTDPAKNLIGIAFANDLIPKFMQSHFTALQSVLESGVPTVRNKLGGHGKGSEDREVPLHFAAYALHLTASNIVFLVECHRAN